jgi:DNA-binding response OmpR family regulator
MNEVSVVANWVLDERTANRANRELSLHHKRNKMRKKVMVVDDQPAVRKLLGHFLSKNYNVIEMADAEQVLHFMEHEEAPDAIIADVMMPKISGIEMLGILHKKHGNKMPPVIMLSGVENSVEKLKCFKKGAKDYINKPFNPEELNIRLSILLNKN